MFTDRELSLEVSLAVHIFPVFVEAIRIALLLRTSASADTSLRERERVRLNSSCELLRVQIQVSERELLIKKLFMELLIRSLIRSVSRESEIEGIGQVEV
jgi:hypothetical protein